MSMIIKEIVLFLDNMYKTTLQIGAKVVQSIVIYCVSDYTDGGCFVCRLYSKEDDFQWQEK